MRSISFMLSVVVTILLGLATSLGAERQANQAKMHDGVLLTFPWEFIDEARNNAAKRYVGIYNEIEVPTLLNFRDRYPMYSDLSDVELGKRIYKKYYAAYYPNFNLQEFMHRFGVVAERDKLIVGNTELMFIVFLLSGLTAFVIAGRRRGISFIILSLVAGWGIGVSTGFYIYVEFTPTADGAAMGLSEQNRLGSIFWVPMLGAAIGTWNGQRARKKKEDNAQSNEGKDVQDGGADSSLADDPPSLGIEASLQQIKSLLDQGLIDQEDYDRKKREILDDM